MRNKIIEAYIDMNKHYNDNIISEEAKLTDKAIVFKIKYKKGGEEVEKMVSSTINYTAADGEGEITIDPTSIKIVSVNDAKAELEKFNQEQIKKVQQAAQQQTNQQNTTQQTQQSTPAAPPSSSVSK